MNVDQTIRTYTKVSKDYLKTLGYVGLHRDSWTKVDQKKWIIGSQSTMPILSTPESLRYYTRFRDSSTGH